MTDRLYVKESTEYDEDGERLKVIQTYESKPMEYSYLIFLDK